MQRGNLRFQLFGQRLKGRFTLARLGRDPKKQEAWFLIKGHDDHAREGVHAQDIERETPLRAEKPSPRAKTRHRNGKAVSVRRARPGGDPPSDSRRASPAALFAGGGPARRRHVAQRDQVRRLQDRCPPSTAARSGS